MSCPKVVISSPVNRVAVTVTASGNCAAKVIAATSKPVVLNVQKGGTQGPAGVSIDFEVYEMSVTNTLPGALTPNSFSVSMNVSGMTADLEVESYTPTGMIKGGKLKLKKVDNTPFKITFNRGVDEYDYVDRKGDILELTWDGTKFII